MWLVPSGPFPSTGGGGSGGGGGRTRTTTPTPTTQSSHAIWRRLASRFCRWLPRLSVNPYTRNGTRPTLHPLKKTLSHVSYPLIRRIILYNTLSHTTHPIGTYRYSVTSILPNYQHKVTPPLNAYQYIKIHLLPSSSFLSSSTPCNNHNHLATTFGHNASQSPHPWLHSYATAESSTIALSLAQALYTRVAAQSSYRCSATLIASIPSSAGASSQTPPPRRSANSVGTRDINTNNEESRNVMNSNVMTHNVGTGTRDEVVAWGNYCPAAMTVLVQVAQVYPATPIPRTLYPYHSTLYP